MSVISLSFRRRRSFSDWRRREQAYAELIALDDHSLADIGIHRSQIGGLVDGVRMPGRSSPPISAWNRENFAGRRKPPSPGPNSKMRAERPIFVSDLSAAQHQRRPSVDHDPPLEHDAAAAVRSEHDRLLSSQQSRQHRRVRREPSAPSEVARQLSPAGARGCSTKSDRILICATRDCYIPRPGEPVPALSLRSARHYGGRHRPLRDRCPLRAPFGASNFAAAIERIPVPVPISSGQRNRRCRASRSSAIRQARVDGCSPVPNAVAASTTMPIGSRWNRTAIM